MNARGLPLMVRLRVCGLEFGIEAGVAMGVRGCEACLRVLYFGLAVFGLL